MWSTLILLAAVMLAMYACDESLRAEPRLPWARWWRLRWLWRRCPCEACAARRESRFPPVTPPNEAAAGAAARLQVWTTANVVSSEVDVARALRAGSLNGYDRAVSDQILGRNEIYDRVVKRACDDQLNELVLSEEEYHAILKHAMVDVLPSIHGTIRSTFLGLPIRVVEHCDFPFIPTPWRMS